MTLLAILFHRPEFGGRGITSVAELGRFRPSTPLIDVQFCAKHGVLAII